MPRITKNRKDTATTQPLLKTVEAMSRHSGIGESKLRELIAGGEIPFVSIGSKKLLSDNAIWEWYERNKRIMQNGVCAPCQ